MRDQARLMQLLDATKTLFSEHQISNSGTGPSKKRRYITNCFYEIIIISIIYCRQQGYAPFKAHTLAVLITFLLIVIISTSPMQIYKKMLNNDWSMSQCYRATDPYSRFIASMEITHCLPNLHTSTPFTSFP